MLRLFIKDVLLKSIRVTPDNEGFFYDYIKDNFAEYFFFGRSLKHKVAVVLQWSEALSKIEKFGGKKIIEIFEIFEK